MSDVDYLSTLLRGIVEYPEEVKIDRTTDEMGVLLSVNVSRNDMGKVIGKSGTKAKEIRSIMNSFGFIKKEKISVRINEPLQS